jgi:putative FmdB family regulatory protein
MYPMPLFEYACRACGHRFEFLTREGQSPQCPACEGADLEKQLSVFAVASSEGARFSTDSAGFSGDVAPCGSCGDPRGPGSCAIH